MVDIGNHSRGPAGTHAGTRVTGASGRVSLSSGRISARRYSRGGSGGGPAQEVKAQRGHAFTTHDLFSWGSRYNSDEPSPDRKKLKIPLRAFGPSLAEARDSGAGVRERFKNYFSFPKENKVVWRDDVDQVRRNRFWFLLVVGLAIAYTVVHLSG